MNMSLIDWTIMAVAVIALRFVSLSTRKYMKGVADFLSANRAAGRYLLTISQQMGGTGAISFIALFEMYYQTGFTAIWWSFMGIPTGMIILLTGWVFYRFRETRAMTMAQFFEMRYSRRFRVFAGFLCWTSGVLNFGIFPAVTARFFMYFCGLENYYHLLGIPIPTFAAIMALDLALALTFVTMGGQVSVMITECVQGIFSSIAFIVIIAVVLLKLQWPRMVEALSMAPADASMLNPLHTGQTADFNVWFFVIGVFGSFYGYMSWQGTQGFYSSARSPHEQRMGGIIGLWRELPKCLLLLLLPFAAYAVLHLSDFATQASRVSGVLKTIDNDAVRNQMRVPVALAQFLPFGIKGLFATTMLFFSFTCHDTYMHSWGSIFVQDVYMPIRKRSLSPEQHMKLLRWSIIGVGVFAFIFSLLYPQTHKILMFMAITGTIWTGGSGAVIIGGLYWKRGTTAAAYTSLIIGAALGVGGLIIPQLYKNHYGMEFPINGQWLWFIAMIVAAIIYILVSLVTGRKGEEYNLEHMLHRGGYASQLDEMKVTESSRSKWLEIMGIRKEFTYSDRILAVGLLLWNAAWFTVFIIGTVLGLVFHIGTEWWAKFWHFYLWLLFGMGIPGTIWFTVGGIIDIRHLYKALSSSVRDHTDDGRVIHEPGEAPKATPGISSDIATEAGFSAFSEHPES